VHGDPKIFRIAAGGGSPPEQLTTGAHWDGPDAITPDGRVLLLEHAFTGNIDLVTLDLGGDRVPRPFLVTPMFETGADLSPDGRWVSYSANYEGDFEVYARPYPGPGGQVRVSTGGGYMPRWSARGDEVFFRCPQPGAATVEAVCAVTVQGGPQLTVGPTRRLFALDQGLTGDFTVSPDGASFYMVRFPPEAATERRIVYAPSWIEELAATPQ